MSRLVLVTGASGFIGGHLCRHLIAAGWQVRAQGRRAQGPPGCDYRRLDLLTADPAELLASVTAIVHLANAAHALNPDATLLTRLNVEATLRLAQAAVPMGLTFVYLSTAKVLGERGHFDDASPATPVDAYARSKHAAEQALSALPELNLIVLRPPLVYGPGVGGNFARLARLAASGWPLPFGALTARRSLIHVDDLCAAILNLLPRPLPGRWLLSGPEAPTVPELLTALARAQGGRCRLLRFPTGPLGLIARALGRHEDWRRLAEPFVLQAEAFAAASSWQPRLNLAAGLQGVFR